MHAPLADPDGGADDLAVSIDMQPPDFRTEAVQLVVDALVRISLRRHGAWALIRTLARPDRVPGSNVPAF